MPSLLYFAECHYGRLGNEFQATDRDHNSRAQIVRQIRTGDIEPIKILEIDEDACTCRDVTDELVGEAMAAREPATLEESYQKLIDLLAKHDHDRDLKKHGVAR